MVILSMFFITAVWVNPAGGSGYQEPAEGPYGLRETGPAGGLIFYINPNADQDGWKYLELAPTSGPDAWDQTMNYPWCPSDDFFFTNTGMEVGAGKTNTALLIADTLNNFPFAQVCSEYTGGGFNDWFAPSRDELVLIYENLYAQEPSLGDFTEVRYWSSSEVEDDPERAIPLYFNDGHSGARGKPVQLSVLPIRAF